MGAHSINDEAAAWAVRLDSAQLSGEEQLRLDEWLASSPKHRGALLRARAIWTSVGAESAATAVPSAPRSSAATLEGGGIPAPRTRNAIFAGLRAAAAVLAVVGLVLGYRALTARGELYETGVGEVRRIALEDGSAITLNSNSSARVHFEKGLRTVTLKRGEGLFEVAKDKFRPFVVSTGEVSVRAVGTAFAVRAMTDEVTVTVTEGVVEVTRPQEPPQRVTLNQRAEFRPARRATVQSEDPAEANRRLAWREGILSFSGESLAEAAREVNRYSHHQVEISDPVLAARPVIGIFRAGDADAFAQATAAALGARYRVDGQVIRLEPTPGH